MATRDLPDIYACALGPVALGLGHILWILSPFEHCVSRTLHPCSVVRILVSGTLHGARDNNLNSTLVWLLANLEGAHLTLLICDGA